MKVKCLCLVLISGLAIAELDYEQSLEISTGLVFSDTPQTTDGDDLIDDGGENLVGNLEGYWNLFLYPSDNTLLRFRYGLLAQGRLNGEAFADSATGIAADYRIGDLDALLLGDENDDWRLYQQLDQLALNWYSPVGDFVIGRQPISFGIAKFYSPIDVIYPRELYSIDTDYRPGVDALRATWPVGALTEVDAGIVLGEDRVAFGRYKTSVKTIDLELMTLLINADNQITSVGAQSGIGQVGLWQESAWLREDEASYFRSTLGADMTFFDDLYTAAELHYNGIGSSKNYSENYAKHELYRLGAVTTLGQWYGSVQASYPLNILTLLTSGLTVNLNDGSALANLALNISLTDTLTIDFSLVQPISDDHDSDCEYGVYPAYWLGEFSWVF